MFQVSLAGSILAIALADLLFQSVDAAAQLIQLFLTGNAEILQKMVAVAFQVAPHLLLEFGGFSSQGFENVVHQSRGLAGVERPLLTQSWVTPRRRSATRVVVPRPRAVTVERLAVSIADVERCDSG